MLQGERIAHELPGTFDTDADATAKVIQRQVCEERLLPSKAMPTVM